MNVWKRRTCEQLSDYAAYLPGLNLDTRRRPRLYSCTAARYLSRSPEVLRRWLYYIDDAPWGSNGLLRQGDSRSHTVRSGAARGAARATGNARRCRAPRAGVIRYVLNEPSLSGFEARVGADVSTTHYASKPGTSFQGMVNVPIIQDALAVRVSGYDSYTPGFIDNVYSGAKDVNVHAPLRRAHHHAVASDRIALGEGHRALEPDRRGIRATWWYRPASRPRWYDGDANISRFRTPRASSHRTPPSCRPIGRIIDLLLGDRPLEPRPRSTSSPPRPGRATSVDTRS